MAENSKLTAIPGKVKEQQFQRELNNASYGRVLPQATELEEAVLGAIMVDKDGLAAVNSILRPESFYAEANKLIFEYMEILFKNTQPIDLLTVSEALRKAKKLEEVGGINYLMNLTNRVASAANIEYHARIVAQKFVQRELIKVSSMTIKDAFEDTKDIFDMLDEAEKSLYEITDKNISRSFEIVEISRCQNTRRN